MSKDFIKHWGSEIDDDQRREVYNYLVTLPDFDRFMEILKSFHDDAVNIAKSAPDNDTRVFNLGKAEMIDSICYDICSLAD